MLENFSCVKLSDFIYKKEFQRLIDSTYSLLEPVRNNYPKFNDWFYNKATKGLGNKREIFLYIQNNKAVGCIILKRGDEKKICTLFVDEEFQRMGLGTSLIKLGMNFLGSNGVLLTVSKEHESSYLRLLNKFNFKKVKEENTYNRKGNMEVYYIN